MNLFCTAFIQVFLVAINTIFLASGIWIGVALASFGISFTWSLNVGRISVASNRDRLIYSAGAMCGSLSGLALTAIMNVGSFK